MGHLVEVRWVAWRSALFRKVGSWGSGVRRSWGGQRTLGGCPL